MSEVRIVVSAAGHLFRVELNGRHLVTARTPLLAAARVLLAEGADPDTPISMSWAGSKTVSMRSTVGRAASLAIAEDDRGIRLVGYRPARSDVRNQALGRPAAITA
ncbi:hypothetical protein [Methylobacterium sp. CM6247]